MLDLEHAALFAGIMARLSAALLASSLLVAARRVSLSSGLDSSGSQRVAPAAWRTADVNLFVAFIVSHTIHFAGVVLMALASSGENIRARGGWLVNVAVAVLFYAACFGILSAKRRPTARWSTVGSKRLEMIPLVVLWADFAQSYLIRFVEMWLFAVLALVLVYSMVRFLTESLRSSQSAQVGV
jgi:hypothetical protein